MPLSPNLKKPQIQVSCTRWRQDHVYLSWKDHTDRERDPGTGRAVTPAAQLGRRLRAFTAVRPPAATVLPHPVEQWPWRPSTARQSPPRVPRPRPRSMPFPLLTSQITVPSRYIPKNMGKSGKSLAQGAQQERDGAGTGPQLADPKLGLWEAPLPGGRLVEGRDRVQWCPSGLALMGRWVTGPTTAPWRKESPPSALEQVGISSKSHHHFPCPQRKV